MKQNIILWCQPYVNIFLSIGHGASPCAPAYLYPTSEICYIEYNI